MESPLKAWIDAALTDKCESLSFIYFLAGKTVSQLHGLSIETLKFTQKAKLQIHNNILPELTDFLSSEDKGLQFPFHVTRSASCVSAGTRCLGTSWRWAVVFLSHESSPPFFLSSSCLILFFLSLLLLLLPAGSCFGTCNAAPACDCQQWCHSTWHLPLFLLSILSFYPLLPSQRLASYYISPFLNALTLPGLPLWVSLSSLTPHPSLHSPPPHPVCPRRASAASERRWHQHLCRHHWLVSKLHSCKMLGFLSPTFCFLQTLIMINRS